MAHAWLLLCASASALVAPVTRRATTPLQASTGPRRPLDAQSRLCEDDGHGPLPKSDANRRQLRAALGLEREGTGRVLDAAPGLPGRERRRVRRTWAREGTTMPDVQWFPVEIELAENLLRHREGPLADAEAVITVSEGMGRKAWTFAELRRDAGRVQRALAKFGVNERKLPAALTPRMSARQSRPCSAPHQQARRGRRARRTLAPELLQIGSARSGRRCSLRRTVLASMSLSPARRVRASSGARTPSPRWRPRRLRQHGEAIVDRRQGLRAAEALPSVQKVVVISSSGKEFDSSEWPASVRDKVIG